MQITPVGQITHNKIVYKYSNGTIGPITQKLKKTLTQIQNGEINDPFGWLFPLKSE